jgi:hypothetical protein
MFSCWSPTPSKLLLILDKNTFLPMNNFIFFFSCSIFFTYFPFLTTLTTTTCSSFLRPILLFPISIALRQEGRPSNSFLNSTPFFSPHFYLIGQSISYLYIFSHSPLNGTTLEDLQWVVVTINDWCLHLHLHHVTCWGAPWKLTSSWCNSPLHTTLPLHDMSNIFSSLDLIALSSFLTLSHSITHYSSIWEVKQRLTMPSPLLASRRRYYCSFDLKPILGTFFEATSTLSVLPYLINLTNLKIKQLCLNLIQLTYFLPYPIQATHPLVVHPR